MATLSRWSPYDEYVQGGMVDGRYMNAAYTMIAAGPPRLANIGKASVLEGALSSGSSLQDEIAFPLGIVQSFGVNQNMNLSRFFEIGSHRSYFIPGRVVGGMQLGRIMYHGPSLLRVLYAYYQDLVPPTMVAPVFANIGIGRMANQHDVVIPPGFENIFLNLASDLFTQPIGMLLIFKDSNEQTMGANFFEGCWVPQHGLATDASGVIIQETASVQYERMIPIATSVVGLIGNLAA